MPNALGNTDPRDEIPQEIGQTIVNEASQIIGQISSMAGYTLTTEEREMFGAGVGAGMAATVVVLQRMGLLRPWETAKAIEAAHGPSSGSDGLFEDRDGAPWPDEVQRAAEYMNQFIGGDLGGEREDIAELIHAVEKAVYGHFESVVKEETDARTEAMKANAPGWTAAVVSARTNEAVALFERIARRMGWPT